jgi:hypothetical protein
MRQLSRSARGRDVGVRRTPGRPADVSWIERREHRENQTGMRERGKVPRLGGTDDRPGVHRGEPQIGDRLRGGGPAFGIGRRRLGAAGDGTDIYWLYTEKEVTVINAANCKRYYALIAKLIQ